MAAIPRGADQQRLARQPEYRDWRVRALTERVRQLRQQRHYGEAAEVAGKILALEPGNEWATEWKQFLETEHVIRSQHGYVKGIQDQTGGAFIDIRESEIPWWEIESEIARTRSVDLMSFGLKDRYLGEGVPAGAVNTTLYFLYNASDRSLTQEEVNQQTEAIRQQLEDSLGWKR